MQYRLKALNRHGVHSPFVYAFNDEVVADKRHFYAFEAIEKLRKQLYLSKEKMEVQDFGAGSYHTKKNIRSIASIAKLAGRSHHYGMLLFRMVNYYQSKNILELGTSLGIGTSYLALANPAATVTSIEGSKAIADYAMKNFKANQIQNVQQIVGNFDAVLPDVLANNPPFDFVFIDGNHQYQPTLNYFNLLITKVAEEAILVFDDIHWSPGMKQAWQEIAADTRVKLSVDVFQFGIVFINKNFKEKQHFIIKY